MRHGGHVGEPSPADPLLLGFYPMAYVSIVLLVRARVRRFHPSLWLDGLVAGLGVAALGALASGPMVDLLLLALLLGVLAALGWRVERMWWWLAAGFGLVAVADAGYLLRVATDTYTEGTPVDAGWLIVGLLLVQAPWAPAGAGRPGRLEGGRALVVPVVVTITSLALLVTGTVNGRVPALAGGLAAAAILAVVVRTALTFREVAALAEAREQAVTDDLTGLPNRRLLYQRSRRAAGHPSAHPAAGPAAARPGPVQRDQRRARACGGG